MNPAPLNTCLHAFALVAAAMKVACEFAMDAIPHKGHVKASRGLCTVCIAGCGIGRFLVLGAQGPAVRVYLGGTHKH